MDQYKKSGDGVEVLMILRDGGSFKVVRCGGASNGTPQTGSNDQGGERGEEEEEEEVLIQSIASIASGATGKQGGKRKSSDAKPKAKQAKVMSSSILVENPQLVIVGASHPQFGVSATTMESKDPVGNTIRNSYTMVKATIHKLPDYATAMQSAREVAALPRLHTVMGVITVVSNMLNERVRLFHPDEKIGYLLPTDEGYKAFQDFTVELDEKMALLDGATEEGLVSPLQKGKLSKGKGQALQFMGFSWMLSYAWDLVERQKLGNFRGNLDELRDAVEHLIKETFDNADKDDQNIPRLIDEVRSPRTTTRARA